MKARGQATTIILGEARDLDPDLDSFTGVENAREDGRPFRLLDSFDGSVRRSGRALIEAGGRLLLVGGSDGPLSQAVAGRPRRVGDLPEGAVSPLRCLLPRAEGTASCRDLSLLDDERKTVARLSVVTLRGTGPRGATIATLQGLRGYDAAFETIAARVANLDGLPAAAADLYRLLGAEDAPAGPAAVPPGTPAFEVTNRMVRGWLETARQSEAGIVADWDTEFLHDYRVAFRKVRSVVSLFRGVYSDAERQALGDATRAPMARTGSLRDLDVHLLDRAAHVGVLPEGLHEGLALLFDRLGRQRAREQRRLAQWLGSPAYKAAMAGLVAHFAEPVAAEAGPEGARPVEEVLRGLVRRRWHGTRAAARRIGPSSTDDEVHDLRIRCKKLRHLLEFAAPVFGGAEIKPLVRPLKALQDELGRFNDHAVQAAALGRLLPPGAPRLQSDLAIAASIGALTAILHQRKAAQRLRVEESLGAFTDPAVRRRYARWIGPEEA